MVFVWRFCVFHFDCWIDLFNSFSLFFTLFRSSYPHSIHFLLQTIGESLLTLRLVILYCFDSLFLLCIFSWHLCRSVGRPFNFDIWPLFALYSRSLLQFCPFIRSFGHIDALKIPCKEHHYCTAVLPFRKFIGQICGNIKLVRTFPSDTRRSLRVTFITYRPFYGHYIACVLPSAIFNAIGICVGA